MNEIKRKVAEICIRCPALHKSPWQKHMKTFLWLYIVLAHLSSESLGPLKKSLIIFSVHIFLGSYLWTHIRCVAWSKSTKKTILKTLKTENRRILTISSVNSFNDFSAPTTGARDMRESVFHRNSCWIVLEGVFTTSQVASRSTLVTSSENSWKKNERLGLERRK